MKTQGRWRELKNGLTSSRLQCDVFFFSFLLFFVQFCGGYSGASLLLVVILLYYVSLSSSVALRNCSEQDEGEGVKRERFFFFSPFIFAQPLHHSSSVGCLYLFTRLLVPSPSSYWFVWEYCGELRSVFEKEKKDVYMLLVGSLLITKRKKRAIPIYPHPQTDVDTQRCNFWVPCNMFASLSYLSKYIFLYRHVDACTIFVFECAIPVQFRFFFLSFQSLCFSASFRCCST